MHGHFECKYVVAARVSLLAGCGWGMARVPWRGLYLFGFVVSFPRPQFARREGVYGKSIQLWSALTYDMRWSPGTLADGASIRPQFAYGSNPGYNPINVKCLPSIVMICYKCVQEDGQQGTWFLFSARFLCQSPPSSTRGASLFLPVKRGLFPITDMRNFTFGVMGDFMQLPSFRGEVRAVAWEQFPVTEWQLGTRSSHVHIHCTCTWLHIHRHVHVGCAFCPCC